MSSTTSTKPEIDLTDKAIKEILRIKSENNIPTENSLRVGVKGGGCSGFTYQLGFEGEIKENDIIVEKNGIKVVIDAKSLFYLTGCTLDFSDGLNGRGFVFNNPNAVRTCGCGQSFGV